MVHDIGMPEHTRISRGQHVHERVLCVSAAAWGAAAGAPAPTSWSAQAKSPSQSTAWEQPSAAAPWGAEPFAKSPAGAGSAGSWSPSKAAAAAAGLVPGLPQSVGAEAASEAPSSGVCIPLATQATVYCHVDGM